MVAHVGRLKGEVLGQRALNREVPGFYIRFAEMRVDGDIALIQIRVGNDPVRGNYRWGERREAGLERGGLPVRQNRGAEAAIGGKRIVLLHREVIGVGVVREG